MKRIELRKIFNEIKRECKLDFALTRGYCCGSCTWYDIAEKYGEKSTGIWLKWYNSGMNKSSWSENGIYYIAHDLTEEQKKGVYNILKKYVKVDWDFSDSSCIKIEF